MSVLKIVEVPVKSLRQKSVTVGKIDKKIQKLISDMGETLKDQRDPEGIGLAAPQVGKNLRLFIVDYEDLQRTVINPTALEQSNAKYQGSKKGKKKLPLEGCLSLPHYYSPIGRANKIKIKYLDEKGEKQVEEFRGFKAQIIQHEIDHLDGVLFVDHALEQGSKIYEVHGDEWEEVDL